MLQNLEQENIKVSKKLKSLIIEIEDDGPGIPDNDKSNVFKPFYKIDNSRNMNVNTRFRTQYSK